MPTTGPSRAPSRALTVVLAGFLALLCALCVDSLANVPNHVSPVASTLEVRSRPVPAPPAVRPVRPRSVLAGFFVRAHPLATPARSVHGLVVRAGRAGHPCHARARATSARSAALCDAPLRYPDSTGTAAVPAHTGRPGPVPGSPGTVLDAWTRTMGRGSLLTGSVPRAGPQV